MKTEKMNTYYGHVRSVAVPHGASGSYRWKGIGIMMIHSGVRAGRVYTQQMLIRLEFVVVTAQNLHRYITEQWNIAYICNADLSILHQIMLRVLDRSIRRIICHHLVRPR